MIDLSMYRVHETFVPDTIGLRGCTFLRTCARACAAYRRLRNRDNVIDDDIERRSSRPRAFLRAVPPPPSHPALPSTTFSPSRCGGGTSLRIDSCTDANGGLSPLDINDG